MRQAMSDETFKINSVSICHWILPDSMEEKQIARVAYEHWQSRGCPFGSPEADWFRAEFEVKAKRPHRYIDDLHPSR